MWTAIDCNCVLCQWTFLDVKCFWMLGNIITSNSNLLKSIGLFFCPADEGVCCGRPFTCTWWDGPQWEFRFIDERTVSYIQALVLLCVCTHCTAGGATNCTRISQRRSMSNTSGLSRSCWPTTTAPSASCCSRCGRALRRGRCTGLECRHG